MKNLDRRLLAIDKLLFKHMLVDAKSFIIIAMSSAFLLGVYLPKMNFWMFVLTVIANVVMGWRVLVSIKSVNRQKELLDESFDILLRKKRK